jgi:hypothetical protein
VSPAGGKRNPGRRRKGSQETKTARGSPQNHTQDPENFNNIIFLYIFIYYFFNLKWCPKTPKI